MNQSDLWEEPVGQQLTKPLPGDGWPSVLPEPLKQGSAAMTRIDPNTAGVTAHGVVLNMAPKMPLDMSHYGSVALDAGLAHPGIERLE
ncbi:MAG: hypothetical protein EOO38_06215 [Cytophagaceae bacterium]|nr:MAG: hypothetical protein EOO38_06215 [Cytophagaceae bacterium]